MGKGALRRAHHLCLKEEVGTLRFAHPSGTCLHRPDFDHVGHEVLQQVLNAVLERRGR